MDVIEEFEMPDFNTFVSEDLLALSMSASGIDSQPNSKTCTACTQSFIRTQCLRRHWVSTHQKMLILHQCPVVQCRFKAVREEKVKDHCARVHSSSFHSVEDRKAKLSRLPEILVENNKFVDPLGVKPPACLGVVDEPRVSSDVRLDSIPTITRK